MCFLTVTANDKLFESVVVVAAVSSIFLGMFLARWELLLRSTVYEIFEHGFPQSMTFKNRMRSNRLY